MREGTPLRFLSAAALKRAENQNVCSYTSTSFIYLYGVEALYLYLDRMKNSKL
jgi:hypothetical protein